MLKGYLEWCADEQQKALQSKRSLVNVVGRHLGDVQASQLSASHVQSFRASRRKVVSGGTVNRALTLIKHAAGLGCSQGDQSGDGPWGPPWMDAERLAQIRGVRQLPSNARRKRRPQGHELARLLNALTPAMMPIVQAGIYSGLRLANLVRLRKREVDLERGMIRVEVTKSGRAHEISISDGLAAILKSSASGALVCRGKRRVRLRNPTDYVFVNGKGQPYSPRGASKAFIRGKVRAGLSPATGPRSLHFHDLRREFATQLIEKGFSIEHARVALGHADLSTTQRYVSLDAEQTREAVASVRIPGVDEPDGGQSVGG